MTPDEAQVELDKSSKLYEAGYEHGKLWAKERAIAVVEELEKLTQEGNNDFQYSRVMAMLTRVRYGIAKALTSER